MIEATADRSSEVGGFDGWLIRLSDARRVDVLSLDSGPAPRVATTGDHLCVFAGELYDRLLLERDAGTELPPHADDAEAILHAYLRLGRSVLDRVKGVFACALWDGETLLVVRDRLGIYPLFWAETGGDVVVSTSAHAVVAQPGVSSAVNVAALVDHLRHRWLDPQETFFAAVRRLPAGHCLTSRKGTHAVTRYWDPSPPGEPVNWNTGDHVAEFGTLLQRAVERSVCPGGTGIFLSGGLDSVAVAALAAQGRPKPWALSLAFPDPSCNEEDVQRAVASRLGLPQVMLAWDEAVGDRGLVASGLDLTAGLTKPLINVWAPAYDELARRGRERGCRVILTGNGGDEWLGVSPYYAADLMLRLDIVGLVRLVRSLGRSHPLDTRRHVANMLWRFGARPLVKRAALATAPGFLKARKAREVAGAIPEWLAPDPELRRRIVERELDAYSRSVSPLRRLSRSHPAVYLEQMRIALDHPLISMEFEETYEQGRRLGMTFRHPFLDSDLVEFLYRTPPEALNAGGRSKGLVRGALARRLPDLGFGEQRKVVATDFVAELMARETPAAWRRNGGVPGLVEIGAVTAGDDLAERLGNSRSVADRLKLWNLLTSDRWLRASGEKEL